MQKGKNRPDYKRYASRFLIVLAVIGVFTLIIIYALKGNVTVSGEFPVNIKTSSVVCNKTGVSYPYTEATGIEISKENSIRIVGTFDISESMTKIALDYSALFIDNPAAVNGEAHMHAALGKKLSDDGLTYSELNNQFSIVDKKVILSFYATADNINADNYTYLLLPYATSNKKLPQATFMKYFENKGYKCVSTKEE